MVWIESPNDPQLDILQRELANLAGELDSGGELAWPNEQLKRCADAGVFRWFVGKEWGGAGWAPEQIAHGYLKLSSGCLTTTFIITQYTGAARRIAGSENMALQQKLLPALAVGEIFATVGISHLTTSRRHLNTTILSAAETTVDGTPGFLLDGLAPWVTGAPKADEVVVGATLEDGRQLLAVVPMTLDGIEVPAPAKLVGLSASQTGPIRFSNCFVPIDRLLAGPTNEVMKTGVGAGTGGVQTSTLAVGVANAAIEFLQGECTKRPDLDRPTAALQEESVTLADELLRAAAGDPVCSTEELRTRANSLALRCAQAALSAAKGTGYVMGHPAGRWCREALFFLVWSCPQPVMAANLCELAGLVE